MAGAPMISGVERRCRACGKRWSADLTICPDDGTALTTSDLASGTMVGEYRIEGKLGEGGMASVFSAVHPIIGKKAAIKIISPALCTDPEAVERFIEEARAVNRIGHPNIVDIFSLGVLPDGRPYLVMEWLQGESLADRIARGRMPVGDVLDILGELCLALDAVHGEGIIHRDLKPDNVFLVSMRGGRRLAKLIDFGIAKPTFKDERLQRTRTGIALGTPYYVSPEQARAKNVDHRTDIYALGVMAYEVLLGRRPFDAESAIDILMLHVTAAPPSPSSIWPEIPKALEGLLLGMLEKDPKNRPSLAAVATGLAEIRAAVAASDGTTVPTGVASNGTTAPTGVASNMDDLSAPAIATVRSASRTPSSMWSRTSGNTEGPDCVSEPALSELRPPAAEPRTRLAPTRSAAGLIALGRALTAAMDAVSRPTRRRSLTRVAALGLVAIAAAALLLMLLSSLSGTRGPSFASTSTSNAPMNTGETTRVAAPQDAGVKHDPSSATEIGSAISAPATLLLRIPARTSTRVEVNGLVVPDARDGMRVPLEGPGEHKLVVTAPGYRPFRRTIVAAAGASVDVTVTLVPIRMRPRTSNTPPKNSSGGNYTLDPFAKELRR